MATHDKAKHDALVEAIKKEFGATIIDVDRSFDDLAFVVEKSAVHDVLSALNKRGFDLLLDVVGVDCSELEGSRERFELEYVLYAVADNLRARVRIMVPEEDLEVPTVTDLWRSANWGEREAFEMFGFKFVGHPCLKRLLTHHEFEGHPLRKDYPVMGGQWCSSTSDMIEELNE